MTRSFNSLADLNPGSQAEQIDTFSSSDGENTRLIERLAEENNRISRTSNQQNSPQTEPESFSSSDGEKTNLMALIAEQNDRIAKKKYSN